MAKKLRKEYYPSIAPVSYEAAPDIWANAPIDRNTPNPVAMMHERLRSNFAHPALPIITVDARLDTAVESLSRWAGPVFFLALSIGCIWAMVRI